ncbi:MAG: HAD hydrolase-like protein [Hyphomicrobiales bacterium]|nr:HAD hydrolase-like protein [Hyphomicrobiales bacterium]MBV9426236.1 HAD hydrolase-like protein [Bradyrhizobiaceae bacterium]
MTPKLISFDVFGTLIRVREGSYDAFMSVLRDVGGSSIDGKAFWEHWDRRITAHYWEPYRRYRDICEIALGETFAHFGLHGDLGLIGRYFDCFARFELYPDVTATLDRLARICRLAVVSNIDDDLFAATPLGRTFDLVCTAERARGYKPDGTLFRYLLAEALARFGVGRDDILHCGQSQFTDMVGAKPLGLTVAWINRRGVALDPSVPKPDHTFPDLASLLSSLNL